MCRIWIAAAGKKENGGERGALHAGQLSLGAVRSHGVTKPEDVVSKVRKSVQIEVQRPDFGLRIIIVWKAIKAVFLFALGISAFAVVHEDLHALGEDLVAWLGVDAGRPTVAKGLAKLSGLTPDHVTWIGVGAIIYACIMAIEGWGLHRRYRWAEWLTVGMTASLIPLELYELIRDASLGKLIALGVNIAIILYLLRHRWLFRPSPARYDRS
jgi:uncharacterized membrane protein (DUF2068 family)